MKYLKVGLFLALMISTLTACGEETEPTTEEPVSDEPTPEVVTWEEKVNEVSSNDGSETQKADEIEMYARDYQPTEEELASFESDIINEYQSGNYLNDPTNHEYILTNLFKSVVVDRQYTEGEAIKDFAFDFYQNTKYVYRGVDTKESESTLANEDQMDKALEEINK